MRKLWEAAVATFALFLAVVTFGTTAAHAATLPARPDTDYYDGIGLLDSQTETLVTKQNEYYQTTKARPQVVLAAIKSTGGDDIDSYAPDLFQKWGIGQKGKDNGILILFAKNGGKNNVHIEVGYGMEAYMTDAKSANLLQAHLTDLKSSDPANVNRGLRAVFKGVARVVSKHYGYKTVSANGTQTAVPQEQVHQDSDGTFNLVMKIVFVLLAMIIILGILFGGGHGGSGGSGHGWPWLWLLWLLGMSGNDRNRNVGGWGGPGGFGGGGFGGGSSGGGGASV